MRNTGIALLALLCVAGSAPAQDERVLIPADEALNPAVCEDLVRQVMPRIESYTRMKFRRRIPVRIEPKAVWLAKSKQEGFAGFSGRHALAYYRPGINDITIVPWTMGYDYQTGEVRVRRSRDEWLAEVEPTVIHELTHGIHHQNFYINVREYGVSLQSEGLSPEEIDRSTVDFLLSEGFAELVSLRTSEFVARMGRHPNTELSHGRHYMRTYQPNGQEPYRVTLSKSGYQDGLDLLHHLTFEVGPRGVRGVLYRPPPRELFFQPRVLGKFELDDPPEPDSIFHELYPSASMEGVDIKLAVNPGPTRYFDGAYRTWTRVDGCLVGYVAEAEDENGASYRYAMFVANPDAPGTWSGEQAATLKTLNPGGVEESQVKLPLTKDVKAAVLKVRDTAGGLYVRAETAGLVILAHESKPTERLEERVLAALRVLYIRRPTAGVYDRALGEAKAALDRTE